MEPAAISEPDRDTDLLAALHQLGKEWGPHIVAFTAARLAEPTSASAAVMRSAPGPTAEEPTDG